MGGSNRRQRLVSLRISECQFQIRQSLYVLYWLCNVAGCIPGMVEDHQWPEEV